MLATVLELVEQVEDDFARGLGPGEFEQLRDALFRIAERIDPGGALGEIDMSGPVAFVGRAQRTRRRRTRRRTTAPADKPRRKP
jgi:hypothetical protein